MFVGQAKLPPGLRIYAIGDVHGRFDCLTQLLAKIDADRAASPADTARIILLGDYGDRGPQSREVIELLSTRVNGDDFICLRGNHDEWFRAFLSNPDDGSDFLYWGGLQTLESYGVDLSGDGKSNAALARDLSRLIPASHRKFLAGLTFWHEEGDYFFCHAGVRPGAALHFQDPCDLMWIRGEFHAHAESFGKVIVHGHTARDSIEVKANRINIDTRAFDTGVLTCLVLENASQRILQSGLG